MNISRNDKCWCGSNLKYKRCHFEFDEKLKDLSRQGYEIPTHNMIKNEKQIEGIRKSAVVNNGLLDYLSTQIKEGISTEDIDKMTYDYTTSHGGIPATLGYEGFPKSLCTSVNDQICHGIPSKDVILKSGDIINVDVTTIVDGFYSDASRMFMIGDVSDNAKRLVEVTKECLYKGIEAAKPWGFLGDVGYAIQNHAEKNGYSVVREFGGHGVGLDIHEDPFVSHVGKKNTGVVLVPGMVFTIEPMINEGTYKLFIDKNNGWTSYTRDGKLSAQWEHTLLITESGVEIISK